MSSKHDHHHHHHHHQTGAAATLSSVPRSDCVVICLAASVAFPSSSADASNQAGSSASLSSAAAAATAKYQTWKNTVLAAVAPHCVKTHAIEVPHLGDLDKAAPQANLEAIINPLQRLQPSVVVATHVSMYPLLAAVLNATHGQVFTIMADVEASRDPALRIASAQKYGVHMLAHVPKHIGDAVGPTCSVLPALDRPSGLLTCPFCGMTGLNQIEMWHHAQMFHIAVKNKSVARGATCPVCGEVEGNGLFVHMHDAHAPPGTHTDGRANLSVFMFGLCIIRRKTQRNGQNQYLMVDEYGQQGYWCPGGGSDPAEHPWDSATRECLEEAGVKVKLTGLLRVETAPNARRGGGGGHLRLRYIFYGEPVDENDCEPKTLPDFESAGAAWLTHEELKRLPLRGPEPLEYVEYIENGGAIGPMHLVGIEGAAPGAAPGQFD